MSYLSDLQKLEALFLQPAEQGNLFFLKDEKGSSLEALLLHLDAFMSHWNIKIDHHDARNRLSVVKEQAYNSKAGDAVLALYYVLYGESKQGFHYAFKSLNTPATSHTQDTLQWAVYLSLAHLYSFSAQYHLAEKYLKHLKVPDRFPHLQQHAWHLQQLVYEASFPTDIKSKCLTVWKRTELSLQTVVQEVLNLSVPVFQQSLQASMAILQLLTSELCKAPNELVLEQCNRVQNYAFLSSIAIHTAQLEMNHLQWASALKRLKRSIRRLPSQPLLWYELSQVYSLMDHSKKAIHALEKSVELMPASFMAQLELGMMYSETGRLLEAIERYLLAYFYANTPENKRKTAFILATLLESDGMTETLQAPSFKGYSEYLSVEITLLLKYEQESIASPATLSHLAKLANSLEQWDFAMTLCQAALKKEGAQNIQCLVNLAYTAWQARHVQEAIYYYELVLEDAPEHAVAHNNLGCLYLDEMENKPRALFHFEKAVQQNPQYATAHFNRGRLLSQQERYSEAALAFSTAKANNIFSQELDNEEINDYLERLFNDL
jgi:tetratricopeptide (TPR) repeat protein